MFSLILAAVVSTNICATCSGKGKVLQTCPQCVGRGFIEKSIINKIACPKCSKGLASRSSRGSGEVLVRCPDCRGTGKAAAKKVQYNRLKK